MSVNGIILANSSDLLTARLNMRGTLFPDALTAQTLDASAGVSSGMAIGIAIGRASEQSVEEASDEGELSGYLAGIGSTLPQIPIAFEQGRVIGDSAGTKRGFATGLSSADIIPAATVSYTMRAFRISTSIHVYWDVTDTPDTTGDRSPYSPSDLTGILVVVS